MEVRYDLSTALEAKTVTQSWSHFPGTILLSAKGGEFRIVCVASPGVPQNKETRNEPQHERALTIVIGQNQNTRIAVGLGNPFYNSTTGDKGQPLAFTKKAPLSDTSFTDYWIGVDSQSGWVCVGTGHMPSK
jgi:hypothetical protein